MGRDRSRSRERRGDRDRDERGRGSDRRDDRGDERRDGGRDDRGGEKRDDRGDDRRRDRSGERRRDRSGERAPASGREDKERERPSKKEVVEEKDDDEFRVGRQVMTKGLQKNPEKNGSIGHLVEFNKEKGRWVVAISGGNNNFKEENLELMADNSDVIDENEEPPTAKVYITKLSAEVTEKDLQALFGGCGLIEKEPPKSGPKGFRDTWPFAVKLYKPGRDGGDACVTYMDAQSAKAAIKSFHRYKFKGSKIGVAYAGQGQTFDKNVELQKPWYMREENQGKMDREGGGGGGKGEGKDGGKGPKPGDWTCESCGASVFASKDTCFKCGASKPSGGAGGSSGGKDSGKGGDRYDKGGKDSGKGGKDSGKGGKDSGKGGKDSGKGGDKGYGGGGGGRW